MKTAVNDRRLLAGFILALVLLGGVAWLDWRHTNHMQETAALVARAHEVQANLNELLRLLDDIETGQRGFVITGDPKFLEPFESGLKAVAAQQQRLGQLILDPRQKNSLTALEPLVAERIACAHHVVDLRRNAGFEAAQKLVLSGRGKATMDAIRARLAEMNAQEQTLLDGRSAAARREADTTRLLTLTGDGLGIGLIIIVFALVRRENRLRHQAQAELDRVFTLAQDLLCIAHADGYFKRVNPAFTATLGWSELELLARPFLDFVHPDDHAATLREVERQLVAGEKVLNFSNRYRHKDGSWRTLSWKSTPQPGGLMFGTARDMTELQQAQEALRASEQEFRSMAEAMPQIVWATRPDGWNIFFNQQWVDYTGLTLEESYGHGWNKPFHPDDQQRAWDAWQQATQNNQRYSLECRLRRADGVYRWWLIRGSQMRDANGKVLKWFGTCTDIEEFKQAQEELRLSEEHLSVTLQSIGDAVLATDTEGRVTRLNVVAEKLTGWTQAEAQGRPVAEVFNIVNEETRQPAVIPVAKVLETGKIQGLANHTVIIARDGTEYPIADSAAPIRGRDGAVLGVVLVFRDVTEEKKAERAIRDSEALNRAVINSVMANIAVVDRHGTIIAINEGWERFARENCADGSLPAVGVGVNYLEVCERAARDLGAEAQEILDGIKRVLANSQAMFKHEYACHSPTEQRWFTMQVSHLNRPEGGAVIAQINITERKRAELALQSSEERYKLVEQAVDDGLWDWNILTHEDYLSPRWKKILGYRDEELSNHEASFFELIHPDDKAPVAETLRRHFEERQRYEIEMRLRHKDGSYRWVLSRGEALRDAAGRPVRMVGAITDITERKRAEEELRMRTRLAEFQAAIGEVLTGHFSLPALLQQCTEVMTKSFDAAFARIWTLNAAEQVLELQASAGQYTHLNGPHARVPVGQFKIGLIAQEKKPHLTNQVVGDPRVGDQAWAIRRGRSAKAWWRSPVIRCWWKVAG
jgi:PAS domain S-box-containing protein